MPIEPERLNRMIEAVKRDLSPLSLWDAVQGIKDLADDTEAVLEIGDPCLDNKMYRHFQDRLAAILARMKVKTPKS